MGDKLEATTLNYALTFGPILEHQISDIYSDDAADAMMRCTAKILWHRVLWQFLANYGGPKCQLYTAKSLIIGYWLIVTLADFPEYLISSKMGPKVMPCLQRYLTTHHPLLYTKQNKPLMTVSSQNGFKIGSCISEIRGGLEIYTWVETPCIRQLHN